RGILVRQRTQEQCVHGAEDRGVGANAECERENGDRGEAGIAAEGAEREAEVLARHLDESQAGRSARLLLVHGDVAEIASRGIRRVGVLQRVERQVEADLLVELLVVRAGREEHAKAVAERMEERHGKLRGTPGQTGFMTRWMASITRSTLDTSCPSRRRPAAVRR